MKLLGKSLYTVFTVLGLVSLSACVGNSSNNQNNSVPVVVNPSVIIDPISSVPVLNGTSTQGTLYIHNYTNQAVSGLNFSLNQSTFNSQVKSLIAKAGLNLGGSLEDTNGFILLNSERCITIAANSSCAINFSTPNLSFANQGSSLINVSYRSNGKSITNSQVVNYSYVDSSLSTGVNFTGNVDVSGTVGTTKYIVAYLYGSNETNGIYKNVNLIPSNPTITISGGFINSQEVAPNQVIAVEYQVAIQNNQKSYIEVTPTWNTTSSISRVNVNGNSGSILGISIDPKQNTANYVFGNVAILNAKPNNTVTISVVNNGNADGTTISADKTGGDTAGITVDTSDCTSSKLQANANGICSIVYTVDTYTPGSTTVEYKDGNGVVVGSQVIYWTNDMPIPAVMGSPDIRNVEMHRESDSVPIQFDFMNAGNAPLDNMAITSVITGPAQWVETTNTCTTMMGVEGSCYIKGYIKPSNDGIGMAYFTITGDYDDKPYNYLSLPVRYMAVAKPEVVITPAEEVSVTVLANNESSVTNTYIAKNIGEKPALITSVGLSTMTNLHKPVIANSGTCNNIITTLNVNESCTVIVTYGPELSSITINESGSTHVMVNYHGGTPDINRSAMSESYNYSLVGNDTYLQESIAAIGFESGTGVIGNPYFATALNGTGQIKISYTNPSVNYSLTNFNLNINSLPYGMKVVSSSCPTESNVASLAKGANCEIIFAFDQELLKTSSQGGSTKYNFITPAASWTTPLGLYKQSGTSIYVSYLQPTASFAFSLNNGGFESTVLTASLANASSGLSPFVVSISSVNDWLESSPIALSNNCNVNSDYSASCNLAASGSESIGQIAYIMPTYAKQNESAMIPLLYSTTNFGNLSPTYGFIFYIVP